MNNQFKLRKLLIKGFKSFDSTGRDIEFGDVNVCIGPNAAGKSNLISFFRMLNLMTTGALQQFIGEQGYSDSILHFGSAVTPVMVAELFFARDDGEFNRYEITLVHASGGKLIFSREIAAWSGTNRDNPLRVDLKSGHDESALIQDAETGTTSRFVLDLLRRCQVFQFHDTSSTAKIRNPGYINDNRYLRGNAGNLAAFLYAMQAKEETRPYYNRILQHIGEVIPGFGDFVLQPTALNSEYIKLDWQERGVSYQFGPHQLSDGSLRFMAMTALLLQPLQTLPGLIILDEPELGLHPAALSSLAGMVKSAARKSQIILATQSPRLMDEFEASDIMVLERDPQTRATKVQRLDQPSLEHWMARYTLSDLWEKNVLGGKP